MILGIDEVGRGCWAGPLVVGAVVLGGEPIDGLTDSKALSKKRRETLYEEICKKASGIGTGWVSSSEIDSIGLSEALKLATKRAVRAVDSTYHEIIIDGTVNFLRDTSLESYVTLIKKADLLIPSVSAASIVAKVERDRYMAESDGRYAGYSFGSHVGYGTVAHRAAIEKFGITPEHRLSFAPLAKYRVSNQIVRPGLPNEEDGARVKVVNPSSVGIASETVAANELVKLGHRIIERNWKTKYCEIDIVSKKDEVYYFSEVKHRKSDTAGDGLAAITSKKLRQMHYAAKFYAHVNKLNDSDLKLIAIATTGKDPAVTAIIEII